MKESLISHQTTVHENKKPFKCGICQKSFGSKSQLNKHQRTVYEIWICKKSFGTKGSRKRHQRNVHESEKAII